MGLMTRCSRHVRGANTEGDLFDAASERLNGRSFTCLPITGVAQRADLFGARSSATSRRGKQSSLPPCG